MILFLALMLAGRTPEQLEAMSLQARAELQDGDYGRAMQHARQTYQLATAELKQRKLDEEPGLPLALGAAIEVQAQAMSAQGQRSDAVEYLRGELKKYHGTSIRARIQKNINLLSLEGKPAPGLDLTHLSGPRTETRGKPELLFFWAHWCSDCRNDAPVVARLQKAFPGLAIVGPTQRYGYVAGGAEATAQQESAYIERVRKQYFGTFAAPVNEENFKNYGASTTPTFVLIDKRGIVRMYHPGAMTYDQLVERIKPLL
ncbi:MAG: TlpA family protein disulfide reductase [Acidobacteriota bacterium]|nr:TlpA family protein disulfide reductase [Acidobacteriota bacterium]